MDTKFSSKVSAPKYHYIESPIPFSTYPSYNIKDFTLPEKPSSSLRKSLGMENKGNGNKEMKEPMGNQMPKGTP